MTVTSKTSLAAKLMALGVISLTLAQSVSATTFTWDDQAANGILFGAAGYTNWNADLVAADIATGATNDFVISDTTRNQFYVENVTTLGSLTFGAGLSELITISGNSAATTSRYLRFYSAANVVTLTNDFTGTVSTFSQTATSGYLGVGLFYTGMGTFNIANAAATLDLRSSVNNITGFGGIYGAGGILKTGAGTLNIATTDAQDNTFTGGLRIMQGTVIFGESADLGTAPAAATADSVVLAGGTLRHAGSMGVLSSTSTSTRGFSIGSAGGTILVDEGSTFTIAGIIADWNNGGTVEAGGRLIKTGAGTLNLSVSTNTFTGGLTILGGKVSIDSMLRLGVVDTLKSDAVIINGGTLSFLTGLTGTTTTTSAANRGFQVGANVGTLEVSSATITRYINGVIGDVAGEAGILRKTGLGTISLTSSGVVNTFSGGLEVMEGTLAANSVARLGTGYVKVDGGTLSLSYLLNSSKTIAAGRSIQVGASTGTIQTVDSRDAWILNSAITDVSGVGGVLRKTGAGALVLNAGATHTGGTLLQEGSLRLNNSSLTSGITASGTGVLQGYGTVNGSSVFTSGAAIDARMVEASGALSANTVGTITFTGDLDITLATAGIAPVFLLDVGTASDFLSVTGFVLIGEGTMGFGHFAFTAGEGFDSGLYTLLTSSNSIVGSLSNQLTGVVGGHDVTIQISSDGYSLQLLVGGISAVPEPATWAAIVGAAALVVAIARRRKVRAV